MTIGERAYKAISDHAAQKGVGIVEYAKSIGISQPNLSHWKNANSEPRAYLLSLMVEAGLDVHWILTGQEDGKVDVVRCKDCKHRSAWDALAGCYWCNGERKAPEAFCSDGERREYNAAD